MSKFIFKFKLAPLIIPRYFISYSLRKLSFSPKSVKKKKPIILSTPKLSLAPKLKEMEKQKFDYFLVLDFEATCNSPINLDPQEIIEFPVLKVNGASLKIEAIFHSFVKPKINPFLTSFCTELTGIIQSMVDNELYFEDVFQKFQSWLAKENILKSDVKFAFVTSGDMDLEYLLPIQCQISNIILPEYMKKWINIKRSFCDISPYTWPDNLQTMLKYCNLEHIGDLHSGLDDAKNIARILEDLAYRGLVFEYNGWSKSKI